MRVEVKCPCCNKRLYVEVEVHDAQFIDLMEERHRKAEAENQARLDDMTPEMRAEYDRLMAKLKEELGK